MVQSVLAGEHGEPQFSFTVGLTQRGLPEVIVYGLRPKVACDVLNDLAERLVAGETFTDGEAIPDLLRGDYRVSLYDVERLQDPLGAAFELYGKENVSVRQLVLPDKNNVLPWESGYSMGDLQPVLFTPPPGPHPGRHAAVHDWRLHVDPHLAVLVSDSTSSGDKPVLVVEHASDGEWGFLDGVEEVRIGNAHMECLHHALDRDPTLVDVVRQLEPGFVAERDGVGEPWHVYEVEDY